MIRITTASIQRAVCEHYGLTQEQLLATTRRREIARPRQVGMYLARKLTSRSLPEIGQYFGGFDHTTVLHACRKVSQLIAEDADFAVAVQEVRRRIVPLRGVYA